MEIGHAWIAWSIRLAMLIFVLVQALQLQVAPGSRLSLTLKLLWTAAFVFFILHVVTAFHFVHGWSHAAAYQATAQETKDKMGFAYGQGVYFNYLFLIVWGVDLFWVWRSKPTMSKVQRLLFFAGRLYLLFIAFNGIVVFKSGWLRLSGLAATGFLALLAWKSWRNGRFDKFAVSKQVCGE